MALRRLDFATQLFLAGALLLDFDLLRRHLKTSAKEGGNASRISSSFSSSTPARTSPRCWSAVGRLDDIPGAAIDARARGAAIEHHRPRGFPRLPPNNPRLRSMTDPPLGRIPHVRRARAGPVLGAELAGRWAMLAEQPVRYAALSMRYASHGPPRSAGEIRHTRRGRQQNDRPRSWPAQQARGAARKLRPRGPVPRYRPCARSKAQRAVEDLPTAPSPPAATTIATPRCHGRPAKSYMKMVQGAPS